MKTLLIITFSFLALASGNPRLSKESIKKIDKSVKELYPENKAEYSMLKLNLPEIDDQEILNSEGKWFAVLEKEEILGWLNIDKAWGRYHEFDYAMIIDTNFQISKLLVLNYAATHGNAVTGRKWLNKFNGFSPDSIPVYGREIDAISGATISGSGLTESVAGSLMMLRKLQDHNLLK
jgi:Na+-translocating ferredoxin:NAD+ oxidoreductase RnfG subunit